MDAMKGLQQDHEAREAQRSKTRAPISLVTGLLVAGTIGGSVLLHKSGGSDASVAVLAVAGVVVAVLWSMSAQLLAEWDRALVLRWGHFHSVRGPGFFMIVPFVDRICRVIDMRVRTTGFYSESMLTRDTVPVDMDAIAFWHVWDSKKAVLEVESYYQAIVMAVQTALRDIVGVHSLAEVLSERDKIAATLQKVIADKTQAWGITVTSIEIRDISIPENLRDALSKQAQAERERQSRAILGQAELEIAQKFSEAAKSYADNPIALQLRAMNIVYEGIRAGGSMMLVPSSVLDTMNLGGLSAMGMQFKAQGKPPPTSVEAPRPAVAPDANPQV